MTVKTITKGITFEQAMKLFTKFVSKNDYRKILQYVYYNSQSGYLVATDSHQLLRVNSKYITDMPKDESFLYDPKNNIFIEEQLNYPDTDRLLFDYANSTVEINNNIKELNKAVKEAKKHIGGRMNQIIKLDFTHHNTIVSGKRIEEKEDTSGVPKPVEEVYLNTLENVTVTGEALTIHCNANYFLNMLDATKKLSKLSNDPVHMQMIGKLRPMHISQSDVFNTLILPVRMY